MKVIFSLLIRFKIFLILPVFFVLLRSLPSEGAEEYIKVGVPLDSGLSFSGGNGKQSSLSVDIIKSIAGSENMRVLIIRDSLENCLARLRRKEIDIVTDIPYRQRRDVDLEFSPEPLYVNWAMILSRPGIDIKDISEINGRRVALSRDYPRLDSLEKIIRDMELNCRLLSAESPFDIIKLIHEGRIDIGIVNAFALPVLPVNYNVKINPVRFDPVNMGFAVLKNSRTELLETVTGYLKSMKEERDSLYYRSMEYHFGKVVNVIVPVWLKFALAACSGFIVLLFTLSYRMNKKLVSYKNELRNEINLRERSESENLKARSIIREKEILVKEIHHRVKNNFMTIQSLLNLQFFRLNNSGFRELINELRNRIMSMSLIHERTYFSGDSSGINLVSLKNYVNNLVEKINYNYSVDSGKIKILTHIPDKYAESNFIITLGLIINELVSNVFKYAFPGNLSGILDISIRNIENNKYSLIVRDNGIGLPDRVDIHNSETLGLEIVAALVAQINGTIEVQRDKGTEFKIDFIYDFK